MASPDSNGYTSLGRQGSRNLEMHENENDENGEPVRLSKEEAEEHVRICKLRTLQAGLEHLKEQAIENGVEVPEQMRLLGYVDENGNPSRDALLQHCPEFELTCDPADLGELGPGYPLFFAFIKYLTGLLFLYALILFPMAWENYQAYSADPEGIMSWNKLVLKNEEALCRTCSGNEGFLGAYWGPAPQGATSNPMSGTEYTPVGTREDYGARCHPWDLEDCSLWQATSKVGDWCCMSWCYVDKGCPVAKASSAMAGLYYAYTACSDNATLMTHCPWSNDTTVNEEFQGQPIKDDRVYEMITPWFLTPGNLGLDDATGFGRSSSRTPEICYVLLAVSTLALVILFQKWNAEIAEEADEEATHPSDFGILVECLPEDACSEVEIADFFEKYALGPRSPPTGAESDSDVSSAGTDDDEHHYNEDGPKVEIVYVVICWKTGDISDLVTQHETLCKQQEHLKSHGVPYSDKKWAKHLKKMAKLREELDEVHQEDPELISSGAAVVTFRHQEHRDAVLKRWKHSMTSRMLRAFHCPERLRRKLPKFRGQHRLKISEAPNPGDFRWENVGIKTSTSFCRHLLSWIIMLSLLTGGFFAIYFLKREQERTITTTVDEETGKIVYSQNVLYSVLGPGIVAIINLALDKIAPMLSEQELHKTRSKEMASNLAKLTTCMVINGGLVVFAANCMQHTETEDLVWHTEGSLGTRFLTSVRNLGVSPKQWYQKGGLMTDAFFMLFLSGMTPFIMSFFDFKRIIGLAKASRIDVTDTDMTKDEFNELHEPAEPEIGRWMANVLKIYILAVVYSPLFPLGTLMCAILMGMNYWGSKYAVLRIKKRPSLILGKKLARFGLDFVLASISYAMPISALVILTPSMTEAVAQSQIFTFEMLILGSFICMLISIPIRFHRPEKVHYEKFEDDIDYYEAQHMWPADWKYRKSHFLYKALPDNLNPENLEPGEAVHDLQVAIKHHIQTAIENMDKEERELGDEVGDAAVLAIGGGALGLGSLAAALHLDQIEVGGIGE